MAQNDLTGTTIKGYELRERIGAGGFGEVYRAFQPAIKREVAVKVILGEYANNPDFIRRFEAEAQVVAHLEHINIVPLYDYWRDHTGAFLVMRWLRGGSLLDVLKKGHWPIDDVARVVDQIAAGLAAAHRAGVVHRDIKPANILLDDQQNVYLADFGIAKEVTHISDFAELIEQAEAAQEGFIGSPDYISPEQIRQTNISQLSDIYSFGLVVYELVTGHRPYAGLPLSTIISKHLMEPLPDIQQLRPDLPAELNSVILRATAKEPEDRYQDAMALAADFRRALAKTTREALSDLDKRQTGAFSMEDLGLPADFLTSEIVPVNPYKGLRAFQEVDAGDFFGREKLIDTLLHRMRQTGIQARFVPLIGPSGSGKSSVLKAGLLPRLRAGVVEHADDWFSVDMVPGRHPLEELEAALLRVAINPPASLMQQLQEDTRGLARAVKRVLPSDNRTELLLVIDQFEEVFTLVESEQERAHFLNSLAEAIQDEGCRLRVMLTLRADFYDRPLMYGAFGTLMSECSAVVLPLTQQELQRAIMEPAQRSGLVLDRDLVADILAEVSEQPGALPLMQYALTELYERREDRRLTRRAYRDIGGVSGALARRADELYRELDSVHQQAARQLFLRLVTLGEGVEDTRRRADLTELLALGVDDEVMQAVIDLYGKYRLLTFDRNPINRTPTVEVAHEALIRQWTLLREWLDSSRDDLRLQRRLATAALEWQNNGRDRSYLVTGARLRQFEEWQHQTTIAITADEREFYQASLAERARQEAELAEQAARQQALEQRSRQFLRALVAVLLVATFGASILSVFALSQRQAAEDNAATATIAQGEAILQSDNAATQAAAAEANREIAERNELNARNLAFVSGAQLALANHNTDLAILLALQAAESDPSNPLAARTLAEAAYAPGSRWVMAEHSGRVETVAFNAAGTQILSAARDGIVLLVDAASGTVLQRMEGHADWVLDVTFSPDGRYGLSASQDTTMILWDLETGDIVRTFSGHTAAVRGAAFNADGSQIVSGGEDGFLILWDTTSGEILAQSAAVSPIRDVVFSQSGFTALSGHVDGSINLWSVQTAAPILSYTAANGGHSGEVWAVAYTPDETGFISGGDDDRILYWTFEAGTPTLAMRGHNGRVTSLAFNSTGTRIVSGSEDNSVFVWDARTGAPLQQFIGHTFLVYGVDFHPNDRQVVSSSWDGSVRLWDIDAGAQIAALIPSATSGDMNAIAYSPTGAYVAGATADGSVTIWDTGGMFALHNLAAHTGAARSLAFSSDGNVLASGGDDALIQLWDVSSGQQIATLEGHSDSIWTLAFSPDMRLIASGSRDNTIIIWDAETGEQLTRLFGHTFRITDVAFSPDSFKMVSSSYDTRVIIWDMSTFEPLHTLEGHTDWVLSAAFSHDGRSIISTSADNSAILWDVEFGQRIRRYEAHSALVTDAQFSPDDRLFVSASADRQILLWDIASGQIVQSFNGHTDAVRSVTFSPDGQQLLSGSADDTARLWAVRTQVQEIAAWVHENRFIREFTCAERDLYAIPPLCATPTPVILPGQSG